MIGLYPSALLRFGHELWYLFVCYRLVVMFDFSFTFVLSFHETYTYSYFRSISFVLVHSFVAFFLPKLNLLYTPPFAHTSIHFVHSFSNFSIFCSVLDFGRTVCPILSVALSARQMFVKSPAKFLNQAPTSLRLVLVLYPSLPSLTLFTIECEFLFFQAS